MSWPEDIDVVGHELSVVLVGCEHIGFHALAAGLCGKGANYIVGLESIDLQDGDVLGLEDVFDDGNAGLRILRRFLPLCLISREDFVSEGFTMIESYSDVRGLFLGYHLVERVQESHDCRCVLAFGVDARVFDESVIRSIYQCVGI